MIIQLESSRSSIHVRLKNSRFFFNISKEIGKACRKSLKRAKRASLTRPKGVRDKRRVALKFRQCGLPVAERSEKFERK